MGWKELGTRLIVRPIQPCLDQSVARAKRRVLFRFSGFHRNYYVDKYPPCRVSEESLRIRMKNKVVKVV